MFLKKDFMFEKDISNMVLTELTIVAQNANTELLHKEIVVMVQRGILVIFENRLYFTSLHLVNY